MHKNLNEKSILPSIHSYQGRYFYLALILVCILIAVAAVGNQYVQSISSQQVERIQIRSAATTSISEIQRSIREVDNWLDWQIMNPGQINTSILEKKFAELDKQLLVFGNLEYTQEHQTLQQTRRILQQEINKLTQDSREFARISDNILDRFPGTLIMQNGMLPHAQAILSQLNSVIHELNQNQEIGTQHETLVTAYRLRYYWLSLLSEFRLLVANHFNVFSDHPQAGINARRANILTYKEQLDKELTHLDSMPIPDELFSFGNKIWHDLILHMDAWHHHFILLQESMSKDDWRQDLYIQNTQLQPVINSINDRLDRLNQALDREAAQDIQNLTKVARNMSRTIALITFLAIILAIVAYLYLLRKIIIPLTSTTSALRKEAKGEALHQLPSTTLKETRELVEAFSEMRQQVWKRQQGLNHLAHHDPLTQLPNRVLLKDRLQHALKLAELNNQLISLMFLDLNNFKQVNDSLGHLVGDKVLKAVAYRLKSVMRPSDTVARLSGDEFAILIENIRDKEEIVQHVKNALDAFKQPISIDGHELYASASIGIAVAPTDDTEPNHLIRDADTAMYEAKRKGTGGYCFFSADLTRRAKKELQLKSRLRLAAEHEEFLFHYQPIVHSKSKSLHCVEALIRWQPINEDLLLPKSFLPTLLEMKIGNQVTPQLLEQVGYVQFLAKEQLGIALTISINMSVSTLRDVNTHDAIMQQLMSSSVITEQLILEITEDTLVEDLGTATDLLNKFKSIGIRIALDDFGTRQSSLNHLRAFPFDIIKIDREFVRDIMIDPNDASLIKLIIQMAHNFDMEVVAEGAETKEQYDFLLQAKCDYIQGYYISRPIPFNQLMDYLPKPSSNIEKS